MVARYLANYWSGGSPLRQCCLDQAAEFAREIDRDARVHRLRHEAILQAARAAGSRRRATCTAGDAAALLRRNLAGSRRDQRICGHRMPLQLALTFLLLFFLLLEFFLPLLKLEIRFCQRITFWAGNLTAYRHAKGRTQFRLPHGR
jgi:hypothetical protein